VGNVNLGATFLNGICADNAGNIFASDFSGKNIYRYKIATQQFNIFCNTGTKTPNGLVFDATNNRLVVATWNANASILGINLSDSSVTTLKTTTITSFDGIAIDEDGNFYGSSWMNGAQGIYFFDAAFANAPLKIVSFANSTNAADIWYNTLSDTLAVPNTGNNTVRFYGFPRPRPTNDFATATVSVSQSICVLQNDLISGNVPMVLQSFSSPQLGSAVANGNCINYTASIVGNDTITYIVCSVDTPSFCRTGTLVVTNSLGSGNHPPVANDDTASTIQPNSITVNVVANDLDADLADTICVTSVYGSNFFSLDGAHCDKVIFTPDSSFVGNDTCWYVLCDNGNPVLCDTGSLVVTVIFNPSLLPIADLNSYGVWCQGILAINNSENSISSILHFRQLNCCSGFPDSTFYNQDSVEYALGDDSHQWEICLTAYNQYGSSSVCDTLVTGCEGIFGLPLSNISLFPNPTTNVLTIDMQNISDEITRNYSSIEIVNALGEKQKSAPKKGTGKVVSLDVSDLPNGIYMATIISDKKERRMLGKFTVSR